MTLIPDEIIMLRVKQGQLSELAVLFERYHVRLYHFFVQLTGNRTESEDLVQNVFYRVLHYRHTFSEETVSFRAWIYKIARNLHADQYRKASMVISPEGLEEIPEVEEAGFEEADFNRLQAALAKLKPADRELIWLNRFEKLKYAEIAELKNSSMAAIKVQIHRAMKELKRICFNH